MKKFFVLLAILFLVLALGCEKHKRSTFIGCHLISLNAEVLVLIQEGNSSLVERGDTITVSMSEVGEKQWKYDVFNSEDTTFWVKDSYTDRTRQKKLPPHFTHYVRAIVK